MGAYVYFAQAPTGEVKIGFTTKHPLVRLETLSRKDYKLTLLRFIEVAERDQAIALERTLQLLLASEHIEREWFRNSPLMKKVIATLGFARNGCAPFFSQSRTGVPPVLDTEEV
jgi:hypothetical protein